MSDPLGTPLYQHDCDCCTYLGPCAEADLYFCTQGGALPTVIARYSSDGADYNSGLYGQAPELVIARERAAALGLLDREKFGA